MLQHTFECIPIQNQVPKDAVSNYLSLKHITQTNITARPWKDTHIQRADLQVQKLNINDKTTMEGGLKRPNKVFICPKQSLMSCSIINALQSYVLQNCQLLICKTYHCVGALIEMHEYNFCTRNSNDCKVFNPLL